VACATEKLPAVATETLAAASARRVVVLTEHVLQSPGSSWRLGTGSSWEPQSMHDLTLTEEMAFLRFGFIWILGIWILDLSPIELFGDSC
jgi:hypothetical protein